MRVLNLLASGNLAGIEKLNIDINRYSTHTHYYCFMFKGGAAADQLKADGAYVNVLNIRIKHSVFQQYKAINRIIEENRIEAIMVHHETPLAWVISSIISKKKKIPFYLYAHCEYKDIVGISDGNCLKKIYKKKTFEYALEHCHKVIAISKYVSNSITERYDYIRNKISIVYNGVDTDVFSPDYFHKAKEFTIIYVGRLVRQKGVNLLIDALANVKSPVKCIIVGGGNEKNSLEKQVQDRELTSVVTFAGVQKNTKDWYKKGTIFVHPAVWEEGFGITIIEAMASGLPCISFKKGALPEIIENGENGFIVDNCSAESMAEIIDRLYEMFNYNLESFNCLRNNAVNTASNFNIHKTVSLLDVLLHV